MGLMDYIKVPFGYLMELCCRIFPNYFVSLAIFTIIIQIILCLVFGIKQQKNSVKQATLAPKVAAINKKREYAGKTDQATLQKKQMEITQLYQDNGYNQFGGCLPMLIQLPVIMGLYYVITEPLRFICGIGRTSAETATRIVKNFVDAGIVKENIRSQQYDIIKFIASNDKSEWIELTEGLTPTVIPEFNFGPFDLSAVPVVASWLVLIPVLIFITSVASQLITRRFTYQDPMMKEQQNNMSMKIMTYSMPLLSVWISFSLPAAVGLYWIYRSVTATVQQIILYKLIPPPQFTEEDYKEAEREAKGKEIRKKKDYSGVERDPNAPKKRSLHHIDDEDDDIPVREKKLPEKKSDAEDAPVIKD